MEPSGEKSDESGRTELKKASNNKELGRIVFYFFVIMLAAAIIGIVGIRTLNFLFGQFFS